MDHTVEIDLMINTLDHVVVCGRDNMSRLLACIQALERLKEELPHEGHDEPRKDV